MLNKNVYIIAGSNGVGKTTFARKFLPDYARCKNFVNADLIASGLSPFTPENAAIKAGKLVLKQIQDYSRLKQDFAFESTLAGKMYVRLLKSLRLKGYSVHIFFLWLPNAELAIKRIKNRVVEGGHNVPSSDVRRRFTRSLYNFFNFYMELADSWMIFENEGQTPVLIAEGKKSYVQIIEKKSFDIISNLGRREV